MSTVILVKVLLLGMATYYYGIAAAVPSTFPDIVPGPGMLALASIGLDSTSLYKAAYDLIDQPTRGTSQAPNLDSIFTNRNLPSRCLGLATANLPDALASLLYIKALGTHECSVQNSTAQWVTAGSAQVIGANIGDVGGPASFCSDVAIGLGQIISACTLREDYVGGLAVAIGNGDLGSDFAVPFPSCMQDAFNNRCKDWARDEMSVAITHTLAVDLEAMTRPREMFPFTLKAMRKYTGTKKEAEELIEGITKALRNKTYEEIVVCAEKGLREILFVVGNDDDLSEINLVPLDETCLHGSAREGIANAALEQFTHDLAEHWTEKEVVHPMPSVKLMTVERKPLKTFSYFSRLPTELQLAIWDFAARSPRLFELHHDATSRVELTASNNRPRALTQACHASRMAADRMVLFSEQEYPFFFDPIVDTFLLYGDDLRAFSKLALKSIALRYSSETYHFDGADAKTFVGLKQIFVLVGSMRGRCETTMEILSEKDIPLTWGSGENWTQTQKALVYVEMLRAEMEKASKKWKAYQRRREKAGKSSPDWTPLEVILARAHPITEIVNPYCYRVDTRVSRV